MFGQLNAAAAFLRKDPEQTVGRARDALNAVPGQQHALLLLASALRLSGGLGRARDALKALAAGQPALAAVHYELGLVLADLEQRDEAIAAFSQVVELEPNHPTAWRLLGEQFSNAGNAEKANHAFGRHLAVTVPEVQLLENASNLPAESAAMGETLLREALKLRPTDVSIMRMLAGLYIKHSRFGDAEKLLSDALRIVPEFSVARFMRANVELQRSNYTEALADLGLLLDADPENAIYMSHKAFILTSIGQEKKALEIYEKLVELYSEGADHWVFYGHALKYCGRTEEAVWAYHRALSLSSKAAEGYWSLANVKSYRFTDSDLAAMREILGDAKASRQQLVTSHFAMGKALEDRHDYAASFHHYAEGNSLRRADVHYDPNDTTALVARSKALFTKDFFKKRAGMGSDRQDPIFIVGLPRSGSTLVEQILVSHSQVEGTLERADLAFMVRDLLDFEHTHSESRYPALLGHLKAKELKALGERYLERSRIYLGQGRPRFTDKTLSNAFHAGFIHLMLPNARIIDIRRHPLANGWAIFTKLFGQNESFFYDLAEIGRYYRDYMEYMVHFDAVLPGRIHRVIYEKLVEDPEGETRRLLEYCGLPFEEACLRFYETERGVRTASSEQVRQPIFKNAIEHWRPYEPWLRPMKEALGEVLDDYPAGPSA